MSRQHLAQGSVRVRMPALISGVFAVVLGCLKEPERPPRERRQLHVAGGASRVEVSASPSVEAPPPVPPRCGGYSPLRHSSIGTTVDLAVPMDASARESAQALPLG